MALTNCSINSTSEVVPQDQGNIISQVLYITPDDGYLVSAVDFSVANRSYTNNSSSLEFVNGTNGVILDIAINSITLSNTTNVGATDNKVKVIVDLENGYTMPGVNTVLTIDIDGGAVSDSLINIRAALFEGVTDAVDTNLIIIPNTESTGGIDPSYSLYNGGSHNIHYFNATTMPGTQLLLATITVETVGDTNLSLTPQPQLSIIAGEYAMYEALPKFELVPMYDGYTPVETVTTGLLKSKTYYLYFTDTIGINDPWPGGYDTLGAWFPSVTISLIAPAQEVFIPVENEGVVDTITTNITQDIYCDPLEVPSCL